jgi:hypothetical protein
MRWIRLGAAALAALATLAGLAVSCGGGRSDDSSAARVAADACGAFYDEVLMGHCATGAMPPASEVARERTRFVQLCQHAMSLPGNGMTPDQLGACAAAQGTASCDAYVLPSACHITGSRHAGAPCNTGWQCESGSCTYAIASAADGGASAFDGCGTCTAVAAVGQSCADSGCVQGSACEPSRGGKPPTCVAVESGQAGARCDGAAALCAASLYCDPGSHTCKAAGGASAPCADSSRCVAGLACIGPPGAGTCQAPAADGGGCQSDDGCAPGLVCLHERCASVTWASSGQPCGGATRCLVGSCRLDEASGAQHGSCPTVIADGQPCDDAGTASMCDELSFCVKGVCTLEGSAACE